MVCLQEIGHIDKLVPNCCDVIVVAELIIWILKRIRRVSRRLVTLPLSLFCSRLAVVLELWEALLMAGNVNVNPGSIESASVVVLGTVDWLD